MCVFLAFSSLYSLLGYRRSPRLMSDAVDANLSRGLSSAAVSAGTSRCGARSPGWWSGAEMDGDRRRRQLYRAALSGSAERAGHRQHAASANTRRKCPAGAECKWYCGEFVLIFRGTRRHQTARFDRRQSLAASEGPELEYAFSGRGAAPAGPLPV